MAKYAIEGVDKLNKQLEQLKDLDSKDAVLAGAMKLQELSQKQPIESLPVKTGFLRASHASEKTEEGAEMSVSAEYAVYQHEGTRWIKAHKWITKAIDEGMDRIIKAVQKVIQDELKKVVLK